MLLRFEAGVVEREKEEERLALSCIIADAVAIAYLYPPAEIY